eukprot:COSAG01_NODE_4567_length_4918_cov_3.696203_1_plen_117_part_10
MSCLSYGDIAAGLPDLSGVGQVVQHCEKHCAGARPEAPDCHVRTFISISCISKSYRGTRICVQQPASTHRAWLHGCSMAGAGWRAASGDNKATPQPHTAAAGGGLPRGHAQTANKNN